MEKPYEVLAMIRHKQQHYQKGDLQIDVAEGPALRTSDGREWVKTEYGHFPGNVALRGVMARLQEANVTVPKDKHTILW